MSFTRTGLGVAALMAAGALVGCGGTDGSAESAADGLAVRLVIPDTSIRQPEVPCSGARAFRFAHPGAAYTIEDADGREVAAGELPEGLAERAFTFDMGDARQPTVCIMTLDVGGVDTLEDHVLVIGDRLPLPIRPNRNLDDIPEVVLR